MWHNARSCARPPRCRLCGSTQHTEEWHSNRCNTPAPHICPPRCIHCHGPYPADHADCPLRRRAGNFPTKLQKSEIRSTGSAKSLRTRTEAGCTHALPTDQMAIDPAIAIATTPIPSPRVPSPTSTPRASLNPGASFNHIRPSTPPPASPLQQAPSTAQASRIEDRPISPVTSNRFHALRATCHE